MIGIIVGRAMDEYRVDIGGAHIAMMSTITFEGATQRNKPDLKVWTMVHLIITQICFINIHNLRSRGQKQL